VQPSAENGLGFRDPENSHEETRRWQRSFGEVSIADADRNPGIALCLARHSLCAALAGFDAVECTFQQREADTSWSCWSGA
jgi:hypothetical protein